MSEGFFVVSYFLMIAAIFFGAILVLLAPTIIAFRRQHPNRWLIAAVSIFLGGTGIGWAVGLVWALNAAHRPRDDEGSPGGESGLNIFANDVKRIVVSDERREPVAARGGTRETAVDEVLRQIERLEKLKAAGHIDDAEFASLKAAALRGL